MQNEAGNDIYNDRFPQLLRRSKSYFDKGNFNKSAKYLYSCIDLLKHIKGACEKIYFLDNLMFILFFSVYYYNKRRFHSI